MSPPRPPFRAGRVAGIGAVHFLHDVYTSFLAPLLPLLIRKLSLSLTQAGALTVFMQAPSLFNPFLGMVADRRRLNRVFLSLAPGATALLLSLIGLAPSFAILALLLTTAGLSVAALHVSGPVMTARLAGHRVGQGMGWFMVGGELARAAGPVIAVWAVSLFTLEGLWLLAPVGLCASAVLWWRLGRVAEPARDEGERDASFGAMLRQLRSILTGVVGIIVARSFMATALMTYLPTFLVAEGHGLWLAGIALSLFEAAGVVGVLLSGTLSDRFGRRRVLLVLVLVAPLGMAALQFVSGWLLFVVLGVLGLTVLSTGPVLMAVMVENAGTHQAAANGTYMALNFAIRASIILVVGQLADHFSLRTAYAVCAGLAAFGVFFVRFVPERAVGPGD